MSGPSTGGSSGLLDSLGNLGGTLVAIVHTRLDLLSSDLEEDRAHFFALLVLSLVAFLCVGVGVVLVMILLVVAFWDTHRLLSLAVIAAVFLTSGIGVWVVAVRKARSKPRLFAASLSELSRDRQQLGRRS